MPSLNLTKEFLNDRPSMDGDIVRSFGEATVPIARASGPLKILRHDLGCVAFSGEDAGQFLHSLMCGECQKLELGETMLTGWCDPKGRVRYLLWLVRENDRWFVFLPLEQIETFIKQISMFVLMAKVAIDDISNDWGCLWLRTTTAQRPTLDKVAVHAMPDITKDANRLWLVTGSAGALGAVWQTLDAEPRGAESGTDLEIYYGLPSLRGETLGQFLPQELNLEWLGGLSFEKGCYPGQEIVARVKFRGRVKSRVAISTGNNIGTVAPDGKIDIDGARVGTLLSARGDGSEAAAMAVVKLDDLDASGFALPKYAPHE
ncbi:MAG: hypothetical protein AAF384_17895 [Pseudomonadota bacterium]